LKQCLVFLSFGGALQRAAKRLYMLQHIRLSVRLSVRPSHTGIVRKRNMRFPGH